MLPSFICYLWPCLKDEEIGGYSIQQNVGGHPVAVFRFPQRVSIPAQKLATVWSGSSDPLLHQPPTDFIFSEQEKWGTGPECTTILTRNTGQVQTDSYFSLDVQWPIAGIQNIFLLVLSPWLSSTAQSGQCIYTRISRSTGCLYEGPRYLNGMWISFYQHGLSSMVKLQVYFNLTYVFHLICTCRLLPGPLQHTDLVKMHMTMHHNRCHAIRHLDLFLMRRQKYSKYTQTPLHPTMTTYQVIAYSVLYNKAPCTYLNFALDAKQFSPESTEWQAHRQDWFYYFNCWHRRWICKWIDRHVEPIPLLLNHQPRNQHACRLKQFHYSYINESVTESCCKELKLRKLAGNTVKSNI